jgi:hypothetical protein
MTTRPDPVAPGRPAGGRRRRGWLALGLWLVASFAIYLSNGRTVASGDSVPAALIPVTLILDGTAMLDRFAEEERQRFSRLPYWLVETPRGTASLFPIMTGVIATPLYLVPVLWHELAGGLSAAGWRDRAVDAYQKYAAAFLVALSVPLFWSICTALGLGLPLAFCLTLLYAFGSEAFALASQSLWQHGPASLAMLAGIRAFIAIADRPRLGALALSASAGMLVAIRSNDALLAAPLVIAALAARPRLCGWLLLPGAAVLAPIAAYNEHIAGNLLGAYGTQTGGLALAHLRAGLPGVLVSPGRGLLVYFPAAILTLVLALARPPRRHRGLAAALAAGVVALTLLNAAWWDWGGGHCFGPRFFTEAEGPILVLLGLTLAQMGRVPRAVALCLALILPYSVLVQALGAYSQTAQLWNAVPDTDEKKRLWDVADGPLLRSLKANLPPGLL